MRTLLLVAAVVQTVLGGGSHFAVRLPFLNPAGVTYLDGPAPAGLAAGPGITQYAAAAPYLAAAPAVADHHLAYAAAPAVATHALAAPALATHAVAAPALATHAVAGPALATHAIAAEPLAYAAPLQQVAAVPTVHHVPGVADVPVTRVQAQPGVIQKVVDVAKPAVSTRKFQLRRPAIQKQFYDIEERVVVRPAGSALVELEEPIAKVQKGPAVINPVVPGVAVAPAAAPFAVAHAAPAFPVAHAAPAFAVTPAPAVAVTPAPVAVTPAPPLFVSSSPAPSPAYDPAPAGFGPAPGPGFAPLQDSESIAVENPDFAARSAVSAESHQLEAEQRALDAQQRELSAQQEFLHARRQQAAHARSQLHTEARPVPLGGPVPTQFPGLGRAAQATGPTLAPRAGHAGGVEVRTHGAPLDLIPAAPRTSAAVVPSLRNLNPEVNQANQQRLIQLLTARGGVAEVGFGRSGPAEGPVGDAGPVRARVLSATPAPPFAEPAGERVSTRRVVVSRPIETVQEIDVVEPVTKLERIAVNHPTVFKTVHHEVARVPTSLPVLGKTLAPIAPAAIPVAHGAHFAY